MHTHKKKKAIQLRLQGKSYNEICRLLQLPSKGTLSIWFRNLSLPLAAQRRLADKMKIAQDRGLLQYNQNRTQRIQKENTIVRRDAAERVGMLTQRELLLIGAALYWGEGYKRPRFPTLSLANSDPILIRLYLRFIREIFKVPDEQIRTHIHIHPNLQRKQAIQFWSDITKLPPENFVITNQVSSASRSKRPKNILPHGTLDIRVHKRLKYFEVMGLIDGLGQQA